MKGKDKFPWSC